jgi:hypothetical protein
LDAANYAGPKNAVRGFTSEWRSAHDTGNIRCSDQYEKKIVD